MGERQEKEIHLLDYWHVVLKRRWVVYTSLAVVVSVTTLGSFLQRPVYTATTRLQIEQNTPKILPFQDVMSSVPDYRNDFYQTQYGLIQSRRVAREAIDSLHLADLEEFRVSLPRRTSNGPVPEEQAEVKRIDKFLKMLTVTPVRNSRLVDIAFSSHDRMLAAKVANRVADTYIAFNSAAQYNTTERATTSLAHQIANLQDEIDVKEKKLQAYARDNQIVALSDKQNIPLKKLNDLSDSYTRAQAERIAQDANLKETDYNNQRSEINNKRGTLEAIVKRQSEPSSSAGLNDLVASNVRIVDVAEVPNRPSSPRIALNILLSLVTGLGLGIGLAFFFEYLDKSVKTPEEIVQVGGIPAIGVVPAMRPDGAGLRVIRTDGGEPARGPLVELISHEDPKSKISEA